MMTNYIHLPFAPGARGETGRAPRSMGRMVAMGLVLLLGVGAAGLAGCIERWVYVKLVSVPPGATVRSEGLPAPHAVKKARSGGGHFLPCSIDAVEPSVEVPVDHWSYVFSKKNHNDEQKHIERKAVASRCADSKSEAKQAPYLVRAALLPMTTEKGLRNEVTVESTPPGAAVIDERTGKTLGKTPLRKTFVFYAPYNAVYSLRIELPGYVPLRRKVHSKTLAVEVHLYRPGETPPAQPTSKKRLGPSGPASREGGARDAPKVPERRGPSGAESGRAVGASPPSRPDSR